jgi:hypothetical protein
MGAGEYLSVSTECDPEQAMLAEARRELAEGPAGERRELAGLYEDQGLPPRLAARSPTS